MEGVRAAGAGSLAALRGHPEGAAGSRRELVAQNGALGKAAGIQGKVFGQLGGRKRNLSEEDGPQIPVAVKRVLSLRSDGLGRNAHPGEKLRAVRYTKEKLKE